MVLETAGLDARREFKLFPTGKVVKPKLKYPKPGNSELRLYFSDEEFKVRSGHYWGVFERGNEIWIFQSNAPLMERLKSGEFSSEQRGEALEDEADDYQSAANSKKPSQTTSTKKSWARDPRIAASALLEANYTCELMPNLPIFVSKGSGKPFVEAHHLISMKMQADFSIPLDIKENICALSPFAHRKIHLARFEDIVQDVQKLASSRNELLEYANISEDELLEYYKA